MPRLCESRGFTLLELALVMLIISLAVAVTYPNMSRGAAAFELRAAGRDVMNIMRHAREKSITEQKSVRVTASREEQQVTLSEMPSGISRHYALPRRVRIDALFLEGKEVSEGPLVIRFLPNGSSETAAIVLSSESGSRLRVVTDPLTGGARIETGQEVRP